MLAIVVLLTASSMVSAAHPTWASAREIATLNGELFLAIAAAEVLRQMTGWALPPNRLTRAWAGECRLFTRSPTSRMFSWMQTNLAWITEGLDRRFCYYKDEVLVWYHGQREDTDGEEEINEWSISEHRLGTWSYEDGGPSGDEMSVVWIHSERRVLCCSCNDFRQRNVVEGNQHHVFTSSHDTQFQTTKTRDAGLQAHRRHDCSDGRRPLHRRPGH